MKKIAALTLSLILILALLTSCGSDTSAWEENVNETFESLTIYKYGDTISADFGSNCNIKINDNNYDHFVKYINQLKSDGYEYLQNGTTPENYNLSDGQTSWRCTNGTLYLQLIFNESDTDNYEMFGCNVQIYGYSQIPESWASSTSESTTAAETTE